MHHNPMKCRECRAELLEFGFFMLLAFVLVAFAWSAF